MTHLEESRDLARMVVVVAERAKARFATSIAASGLSVPLARTLLVVGGQTPMRSIADQLACDPSHVTGIADQLEERGLVIRTTGKDRRVKVLELTPEGERVQAELARDVEGSGMFAAHLDPTDRATLRELLQRLLDEDEHPTAAPRGVHGQAIDLRDPFTVDAALASRFQ